jgi:hypothetical protein
MRKILFLIIPIGILLSSFSIGLPNPELKANEVSSITSAGDRLMEHVKNIKEYINANPKYNTDFAFFVDMRIMSGKNRFIVYDLKNDKILDQGLVAHGLGTNKRIDGELKFSNESSSFCTSLGKYYVGKNYNGQYGKAYKLFGLDPTNSNAFSRNIVLHKYNFVPYEEQDRPICVSLGCPMLNEIYFNRIEKLIDNSKSNILLDIYY